MQFHKKYEKLSDDSCVFIHQSISWTVPTRHSDDVSSIGRALSHHHLHMVAVPSVTSCGFVWNRLPTLAPPSQCLDRYGLSISCYITQFHIIYFEITSSYISHTIFRLILLD